MQLVLMSQVSGFFSDFFSVGSAFLSAFAGALASAFGAPFAYARRGNQNWTEVCSLMSRKTNSSRPFLAGLERKLAIVPAVSQAQRTTSWMPSDAFF